MSSTCISLMYSRWMRGRYLTYVHQWAAKYVSIYLNDNLKPELKLATFHGHAVLNEMQCFILVTFKNDIPRNEVHGLGVSQHTLSLFCGRYIRITSEKPQVHLNKNHWSQLLDLGSASINRGLIKYSRRQDEHVQWRKKGFESKSFCTPPDTNAIDYSALWNELKFKNTSLSDDN